MILLVVSPSKLITKTGCRQLYCYSNVILDDYNNIVAGALLLLQSYPTTSNHVAAALL